MDYQLNNLSAIYKQYFMRQPKFTQILVNVPLFNSMNTNIFRVRQALSSNILHHNLSLLDYELKSIFYTYGTSIIPLQQMYTNEGFNYLIESIKEEFSFFLTETSILDEFTKIFTKFYEHNEHPFEIALKEIIQYTSNKYTIITKRTLSYATIEKIRKLFPQFILEFIAYNDFMREIKIYDNVIFIGSPKIYTEAIFQHINANHFYFVLFSCYFSELKMPQWIEHERIYKSFDLPVIQKKEILSSFISIDDDTEEANIHITEAHLFQLVEPTIPDTLINSFLTVDLSIQKDKFSECKLLELEGNRFLFEEVGLKAKCDVVTTSFLYERKHLNDILINEFIILIDFYNWEDRKELANRHFKKNGIIDDRKKLANLKRFLIKQIRKYGIEKYTADLNKKLDLNLKEYQILGLTKKESFQLKNQKVFYSLLKHITKNEEIAMSYYKACTNLTRYHNRVGHLVRSELRSYLDINPKIFKNIDEISKIRIPSMEFLKVELFRIKRISTQTYQVPLSRIGVPLSLHNEEVI